MKLNLGITIAESDRDIKRKIINAIGEEVNDALSRAAGNIKTQIRTQVISAIIRTPEYQSLLGGQLQHELGVENTNIKLQTILGVWIKSVQTEVKPARKNKDHIDASLHINMIKGDFSDVLSLPEAIYITDKGTQINWLEWLLLEGDKIIVRDYEFRATVEGNSRTGFGIMVAAERSWRVPPEFSGTVNDNFVTRALLSIDKIIDEIVEIETTKAFR